MGEVYKLDDDFIEQYSEDTPDWGPFGWVVYRRTYARYLEDKGRKEKWHETCRRVIEGNFSLTPIPEFDTDKELERYKNKIQKEMQEAYHHMFNFHWLPPGRGIWMSGSDYHMNRGSDALVNCWFTAVRPYKGKISTPFLFMLDESMKGGGVGFSVEDKNISKIPAIESNTSLKIICREDHADIQKGLFEADPPFNVYDEGVVYYRVEDSREGWRHALELVIDSHWNETQDLVVDVTDVRPSGARIKGFGGVSAGPQPLVWLLRKINTLINSKVGEKISPVDATDMMNYIGCCVVSGNVRRSSQIALGNIDDHDFIRMKQDEEALEERRWASNNSVVISDFEDLDKVNWGLIAESMCKNGEPGVFNLYNSRKYGRLKDGNFGYADPRVEGTNPCGEISLESGEPCNLVEIFPYRCMKDDVPVSKVVQIATKYSKRVTLGKYEWEQSRNIIRRNRRIGVSLSGIQDWICYMKECGFDDDDIKWYLNHWYFVVKSTDQFFSRELDVNESIKLTTVKPSGTVSKLPGVSSGMHWHYAKYMIRRIRFQSNDPLVDELKGLGFNVEDDVYSSNTVVVEFPYKAPSAEMKGFKTVEDVSVRDQIEMQLMIQTYWSDNAVSATISIHDEEPEEIAELLKEYAPKLKSTSLLPYKNHGYKQAPIEPITEERYGKMVSDIERWPSGEITSEDDSQNGEFEIVEQESCEGGACPVK